MHNYYNLHKYKKNICQLRCTTMKTTTSPFRDCTNSSELSLTKHFRKSNDKVSTEYKGHSKGQKAGRSIERRKAIQKRRTRKERNLRATHVFNGGPWTKKEKLDFLRGLRKFGPGKWKKIQTILKTRCVVSACCLGVCFDVLTSFAPRFSSLHISGIRRSNIQIKSHGQKILSRLKDGEDIYLDLERAETAGESPCTPTKPPPNSDEEDEDDSYSTASTAPSTSPSSSSQEEIEEMASTMNGSWSGKTVGQVVEPQNEHHLKYTLADSSTLTNTGAIHLASAGPPGNSSFVWNNQFSIQQPTHPASTLNLDEAAAVIALCAMAKPDNPTSTSPCAMV